MNIKFLKDEDGDDWDVGDSITIEATVNFSDVFSDTSNKTNLNSVQITITGYNNNVVINAQSMTNNDTGEYYYVWDTTGEDPGDYEIEVDGANGASEVETAWIRLKE